MKVGENEINGGRIEDVPWRVEITVAFPEEWAAVDEFGGTEEIVEGELVGEF